MAEMVKRKKFLDGEVLDLSEQIAVTSPMDRAYCNSSIRCR